MMGATFEEMNHPPADEDDAGEPDRYRRIASDPAACLAQAAEILDWAFQSDAGLDDIRSIVPLANAWMRLSQLAAKHRANSSDHD
jgi:hypothetical protein